ncbi:MAG: polysaccharide deacetylase family protein [Gammaproteobacteria bacterium]
MNFAGDRVDFSTQPGTVLSTTRDFNVLIADDGDSYSGLAEQFLNDPGAGWYIRSFNSHSFLKAGDVVVVPRRWLNPRGITPSAYQTIPILTYHRFRNATDRLSVTPQNFRAQLTYLRDNGYTLIRLTDLEDFLAGRRGLPSKTAMIAIDDGYRSTYKVAFPILRELNVPAVVYMYSDYMNRGGLKTSEMREMLSSGLIEFQAHSKTHANFGISDVGESPERYLKRMKQEVNAPKERIQKLLGNVSTSFAYPYGITNRTVLELVEKSRYTTALTVTRGGVSAFSHPLLLKRSMVFGEYSLGQFVEQLTVSESIDLPGSR